MFCSNRLKPLTALLALASACAFTPALAADPAAPSTSVGSDAILQQIADNTNNILTQVNNLPTYMNTLVEMATSFLQTDSDSTSFIVNTQADFSTLGAAFSGGTVPPLSGQQQLMADVIGSSPSAFTTPTREPAILGLLPNVNNLAYSTLLGTPPVTNGPVSAYDYTKYAAGMSLSHLMPSYGWRGQPSDVHLYTNYYNTIISITSFDAFVLSSIQSDLTSTSSTQANLITQATSSTWLAQVATEALGKVLRHILLFESQNYVLMTKLLQTERQQLTAQAMTNTLLIMSNYQNETQLVRKAQGLPPKG